MLVDVWTVQEHAGAFQEALYLYSNFKICFFLVRSIRFSWSFSTSFFEAPFQKVVTHCLYHSVRECTVLLSLLKTVHFYMTRQTRSLPACHFFPQCCSSRNEIVLNPIGKLSTRFKGLLCVFCYSEFHGKADLLANISLKIALS